VGVELDQMRGGIKIRLNEFSWVFFYKFYRRDHKVFNVIIYYINFKIINSSPCFLFLMLEVFVKKILYRGIFKTRFFHFCLIG